MSTPYPTPPGPVPPPRRHRRWPWIGGGLLGLCVVILVVVVATAPGPSTTPAASAASISHTTPTTQAGSTTSLAGGRTMTVQRVVDGDTVEVLPQGGGSPLTVRVLGIDTPETVDPDTPVQCYGPEASAWAHRLLTGRTVTVRTDPTQDTLDRYGRTLAYLTLPGGRDYSLLAVTEGYARAYTYDTPVEEAPRIQAAQADAQSHGRGLWGPPCQGATASPTPSPAPAPTTTTPPQTTTPPPEPQTQVVPAPAPRQASNCVPSYSGCIRRGPDLDCSDIGHQVSVHGADPYRLDADGDGVGCESY